MGCFACLSCRRLLQRREGKGRRCDVPPAEPPAVAVDGDKPLGGGPADGCGPLTPLKAGLPFPSAPPPLATQALGHESLDRFSELSTASSRAEQMQYLVKGLGLDRTTASLMYKAERLQEKGQARQALLYYGKVLEVQPNCREATVNTQILEQMLREQRSTPSIPDGRTTQSRGRIANVGRMEVFWMESRQGSELLSARDFDPCAITAAHRELQRQGLDTPFVTLLRNQVVETIRDGACTLWSGRAVVEATLVPNDCVPPRRSCALGTAPE